MEQKYEKWPGYSYNLPENHPVVSLMYLVLLMIVGTTLLSVISIFFGLSLYGADILSRLDDIMAGNDPAGVNFLKIIQTSSSVGMFVLPPLLLAYIERRRTRYFNFKPLKRPLLWIFTILIILAASPMLELVGKINEKMQLPVFLDGLEKWMKAKELELEKVTKVLLTTKSYGGLFFNLFMIAVVPAIGEELVFRGVLQNALTRWTKNVPLAIWLTAIIFSAIHVQFYGFLPRMLLGALFGYLLLWSGSIWLPMLAHFINNGSVVVYAFILLHQGKSLDKLDDMPVNWYYYPVSAVVVCYLLFRFWKECGKLKDG
ncbi:hypothetical protein SAMN05216436_113120 [bacterium A37T11]|nr:hypothetical protein SAMN05216436_113120 [bacterium A37T11]